MTERQHYRSPQLVRRTACCGREAWTANGKLWCPCCGQQVLRPTDVFARFKVPPGRMIPPSFAPQPRRRGRAVNKDQEAML